tara:strand:- start:28830 stop:33779 length:4950 start_codon:yes stop_codon:yes gene_type:complete
MKRLLTLGLLSGAAANPQYPDEATKINAANNQLQGSKITPYDSLLLGDGGKYDIVINHAALTANIPLGDSKDMQVTFTTTAVGDSGKRVGSTKVRYWSNQACSANGAGAQVEINAPPGILVAATVADTDIITTRTGCIQLEAPDDGDTKYFGELKVKLDLTVTWDGSPYSITIANQLDGSGVQTSNAVSIGLKNAWRYTVDTNTPFAGDAMNATNHGITPAQLLADDVEDQKTELSVEIASAHNMKVPNVDIADQSFLDGSLSDMDVAMSADFTKYQKFKGGVEDKTDTIPCTPSVANRNIVVSCSGTATFKIPYDHVRAEDVAPSDCDAGALCAGKLTFSHDKMMSDWYGAGIQSWATSSYDCKDPVFSQVAFGGFTAGDPPIDLSQILAPNDHTSACTLSQTLSFSAPSSTGSELVSGCATESGKVGEKGTDFFTDQYALCLVAEPGVYDSATQTPQTITIGTAVSADLIRNTKSYSYGFTNDGSGPQIIISHTGGPTVLLETQSTRTCAVAGDDYIVDTALDAFKTERTAFETDGAFDLSLLASNVKFVPDDINVKGVFKARCGQDTTTVKMTCVFADKTTDGLATSNTEYTATETKAADTPEYTYTLEKDTGGAVASVDASIATEVVDTATPRDTSSYKKYVSMIGGQENVVDREVSLVAGATYPAGDTYAYNCGTGSPDVMSWSKLLELPCDGDKTLSHTITRHVYYSAADLEITPTLGTVSISEADYISDASVGTITFSSTAIANDIDIGRLTAVSVSADFTPVIVSDKADFGTTFVASGCSIVSSDIVCDLVISGTRLNDAADQDHILTFKLEYKHHTAATCAAEVAALGSVTAGGATFRFEHSNNQFRGAIQFKDTANANAQDLLTTTQGFAIIGAEDADAHVIDAEIDYPIKMYQTPATGSLIVVVKHDEASTCNDPITLTFVRNNVIHAEEHGGNDGTGVQPEANRTEIVHDGQTDVMLTELTANEAGQVTFYLKVTNPYDKTEKNAGDALVGFEDRDVLISQCADKSDKRRVSIKMSVARDPSTPAVRAQDKSENDWKSLSAGITTPDILAADLYTKWDEVTLEFQHFNDDDEIQSDKVFTFGEKNTVDELSCPHHGFVQDDTPVEITSGRVAGFAKKAFAKNADCETYGKIGFTFDGLCYQVRVKCNRHAGTTPLNFDLNLDYRMQFSRDSLSVVNVNDKKVSLGGSCNAGGTVTLPGDTKCQNVANGQGSVAVSFAEVLVEFKQCSDKVVIDGGHKWNMSFVQHIEKSSQEFCDERELELQVIHKGSNSATLTINTPPTLNINLALTDLAYVNTDCSADHHRIVFKIQDTTTGVDITAENSMINDAEHGSQFDLTSGAQYSYIGDCADYCGVATSSLEFDFDAKGSKSNQDFYADVTGTLTLVGDPCLDVVSRSFKAEMTTGRQAETGDCANADFVSSGTTVALDQQACFKLAPLNSTFGSLFEFVASKLESREGSNAFVDQAGLSVKSSLGDGYVWSVSDVSALADKTLKLTVDWDYKVDGTGRRLRTTYTLGSGSGGHSDASIRVLPAGVQVQDQIEAAAPVEEPVEEAEAEEPETEPAPAPAPSDTSDSGLSMEWIIIIVLGSVVAVGAALWAWLGCRKQSVGRNDSANVQVVGVSENYKYKKLSRFTSNIDF